MNYHRDEVLENDKPVSNKSMDLFNLLEKLTLAASFKFKEDGTCPGVVVSKLRKGYYCSLVRYPGGATSKMVVCKAEGSSLDKALLELSERFLKLAAPELNPLDELRVMVHG